VQDKIKENSNNVNEALNSVSLLKTLSFATSSGGDGDNSGSNMKGIIDALETLVDNLRKECYAKFGDRDEMNGMGRKIEQIQEHLKHLDESSKNHETSLGVCRDITDTNKLDIDDLKKFMKEMKAQNGKNINTNSSAELNPSSANSSNDDILRRLKILENEMKTKLDCDVFDNEVALLRAMIGNLEGDDHKKVKVQVAPVSSAGTNLSSKEINTLKDMIERMP